MGKLCLQTRLLINSKKHLLVPSIGLIIVASCAQVGMPSGGKKDITPPASIKMLPENNSLNFKQKKFRIYFNEYIKLKDIQKKLLVSPPLKQAPQAYPQGTPAKYVEIKFTDTLKENATYVFNFGNSIEDNNEGNALKDFKYIFSTGNELDSLTLEGIVHHAYKTKLDGETLVMLHEIDTAYTDSAVYKKVPTYITTTKDTLNSFRFTNLRAGRYKLIALKDKNGNYKYEPKLDEIGFYKDTITLPTDSLAIDIRLFKEIPAFKPGKPSLVASNRIVFPYEGERPEDFSIELISQLSEDVKRRVMPDAEKDTINYWFTPTKADSLVFRVAYHKTRVDTAKVRIRKMYKDSFGLSEPKKGILSTTNPYVLAGKTPIVKKTDSLIGLFEKDTVPVPFKSKINEVTNSVQIDFDVDPSKSYKLIMLPGALEDLFQQTNDTLVSTLKAKSVADYSNLKITLIGPDRFPIIIDLIGSSEKVVETRYVDSNKDTSVYFENVDPADYRLRIIYDDNKNKKWDTGDYLKQRQPEEVIYYPKKLALKPNWEVTEQFLLE